MSDLPGSTIFITTGTGEVAQMPDGVVVYDQEQDKVHYLNPTAAVVYLVCDGHRSISAIGEFLRDIYGLDDSVELEGFFTELEQAGLVCRVE